MEDGEKPALDVVLCDAVEHGGNRSQVTLGRDHWLDMLPSSLTQLTLEIRSRNPTITMQDHVFEASRPLSKQSGDALRAAAHGIFKVLCPGLQTLRILGPPKRGRSEPVMWVSVDF